MARGKGMKKLCSPLLSIGSRRNLSKIWKRRFKRCVRRRKSISCLNSTKPICIPLHVQIEILLTLPVRSLLRFRCVSKEWSFIITSRDFRIRYPNTSSAAPLRLLVSFGDFDADKLMVVSFPNPEGEDDASVPCTDMSLLRIGGGLVCGAVRGLICFRSRLFNKVGICNPGTKQLQILPELKYNSLLGLCVAPSYCFGYDPVEDEYKVLAIDNVPLRLEHKVVVLGGGAWKETTTTTSCPPHTPKTMGICMNGFIYYRANRTDIDYSDNPSVLVCFDVRFEKFNIIKVPLPEGFMDLLVGTETSLINYRGKVGVVEHPRYEKHGTFRMWVLENAKKEEWSLVVYLLPKSAFDLDFDVVTFISSTCELCLVPTEFSLPFCLHYYNLQTNRIREVTIQGLHDRNLKGRNDHFLAVSEHVSESIIFLDSSV